MPTPDCNCYNELINMKETFKRKCFDGKSSSGQCTNIGGF